MCALLGWRRRWPNLPKRRCGLHNAQMHLAEVQARDQTEARERERRLDERIEKLVSAIGELIKNGRSMPPKREEKNARGTHCELFKPNDERQVLFYVWVPSYYLPEDMNNDAEA